MGSDLTVKIGDYGTSIDKYKVHFHSVFAFISKILFLVEMYVRIHSSVCQNEYYIVGDMAVPIRWCAPETLNITTTTIETKQVIYFYCILMTK